MKVAVVGLAGDAPYAYGEMLKAREIVIACVWDYQHSKADEYARRFSGTVVMDLDQVADCGVDGAILTVKKGDHARYAIPLIEGGVPLLIANPSNITPDDAERIGEASREHGTHVMLAEEDDTTATMEALLDLCDTGEGVRC